MQIEVVKSKIHRVKCTGADLNYIGSITIDPELMEAADLFVINKTDLAPYVNADLAMMDRDSKRMRGERPFIFTNLTAVFIGQAVEEGHEHDHAAEDYHAHNPETGQEYNVSKEEIIA